MACCPWLCPPLPHAGDRRPESSFLSIPMSCGPGQPRLLEKQTLRLSLGGGHDRVPLQPAYRLRERPWPQLTQWSDGLRPWSPGTQVLPGLVGVPSRGPTACPQFPGKPEGRGVWACLKLAVRWGRGGSLSPHTGRRPPRDTARRLPEA